VRRLDSWVLSSTLGLFNSMECSSGLLKCWCPKTPTDAADKVILMALRLLLVK